jgi:AcrR family transcriptional regulator
MNGAEHDWGAWFAGPALREEAAPVRALLTRAEVVRQALLLLDEAGFDGLTMRRLAGRLGVKAASLYYHVRNKDEVLALLADAICSEIGGPDPDRSWRENLELMAAEYRRVLLSHRDAARVLAATPPVGPDRLRTIEQALEVLCSAGFPDEAAADAAFIFNSYVVGFALDESLGWSEGGPPAGDFREQAKQWYKSLPAARFPRLVALADHLFDPTPDRRFEFGLTALLDGLEAQLSRAGRG